MGLLRNITAIGRRSSILFALLAVAGCTRYEYEIDLTPRGNEIERTLLASKQSAPDQDDNVVRPLPEEALRLEQMYGQPSFQVDDEIRLTSRFSDRMPQDIGGAGSYTYWETLLGSASFYVERFRGNPDLMQDVEVRLKAAELAVDLLKAFVDAETTDSPAGQRLREFVANELRQDVKNLTLLIWALGASHEAIRETENLDLPAVRLLQFLRERNYLTVEDVPHLIHWQTDDIERRLCTMLARKLDLTEEELTGALPRLTRPEDAEKAFHASVFPSDAYQASLNMLSEVGDIDPTDRPEAGHLLFDLILFAIGPLLTEHDTLLVRLHPSQPPHATNGTLSDDGSVEWDMPLAVPGKRSFYALPPLCFASWSEPNEKFQTAHFGTVLLKGHSLGQYVLWRCALNENQGRQWDAFLAALSPADDLESRLDAFRFSTTPADVETDPRIEAVKGILLNPDEPDTSQ